MQAWASLGLKPSRSRSDAPVEFTVVPPLLGQQTCCLQLLLQLAEAALLADERLAAVADADAWTAVAAVTEAAADACALAAAEANACALASAAATAEAAELADA